MGVYMMFKCSLASVRVCALSIRDGRLINVSTSVFIEWCSGNRSDVVTWSTNTTINSTYHSVQLQSPIPFAEATEQAEDSVVYFASPSVCLVFLSALLIQNVSTGAQSDAEDWHEYRLPSAVRRDWKPVRRTCLTPWGHQ